MDAGALPPARKHLAWQLSGFYASYFLAVGLFVPFWPLWLDSKGLSAVDIGWILAAAFWIKVAAQPAIAAIADLRGRTRWLTCSLMTMAAAGFMIVAGLDGFWPLLIVSALTAACYQPVLPIMESVVLRHAAVHRLDYGRIRLWGSIGFIFATIGGGWWLEKTSAGVVIWFFVIAMILVALACATAPDRPGRASRTRLDGSWPELITPAVILFVATAGLINTSHSILYGFATLYWRSLGHSETLIGCYWAMGVIAEIGLFVVAGRCARHLGAAMLLVLAALGGTIRWSLLAITTDPTALLALQILHGLTFGAAHLGAMAFLQQTIPPDRSATGQSLYSAFVGGVLGGCMLPVAGLLYTEFAAMSFLVMAAMSAAGLVGAIMLFRVRPPASA